MERRRMPTDEEKAQIRTMINEMVKARIDMFAENAPAYAQALGTFRAALQKSGFSAEESMQIVLKTAEQPGRRGFWGGGGGGRRGHWDKGSDQENR